MKAALAAVLAGWLAFASGPVAAQCLDEACVRTSADVGTVTTQDSVILNGLLKGSLGTDINLTVADQQKLADASISIKTLTDALNAAGVGNDAATALGTTTLNTTLTALAAAARADGSNTAAVAAAAIVDKLRTQVASIGSGSIALGDLLTADLGAQALTDSELNLLDFVTGSASAFNKRNLVALTPVQLTGASLGLGSLVNTVELAVVVLEPAKFVCGRTGAQFYSAALRVRARISLVANTQTLSLAGLTSLSLSLAPSVDLIAAVGRASGTLQAVDALAKAVSLEATPGVAELYLGTVSDVNFIDRSTPIDRSTELTAANIATLSIGVTSAITATASVTVRGYATGTAPTPAPLSYLGPYPQTKTASSGGVSASTLLSSLLGSLEVNISAFNYAPPLLAGLGASILTPLLTNVTGLVTSTLRGVSGTLGTVLGGVLSGAVDPLLTRLGVKIGAVDVTVEEPHVATDAGCVINGSCIATGADDPSNPCLVCNPTLSTSSYSNKPSGESCSDGAFCTVSDQCDGAGSCTGTPNTCSDGLSCSADSCDEAMDRCVNEIGVGCVINGTCVAAGSEDPANACRGCNPLLSLTAYSNKPAGASCADGLFCTVGDACNGAGACTSAARDCSDGLTCTLDACDESDDRCTSTVSTGCTINDTCVATGVDDPSNPCRACNPAVSTTAYTNKASGTSCEDGLYCTTDDSCSVAGSCVGTPRVCAGGVGCSSVCDEAQDRCRTDILGCQIGGACVAEGTLDPLNPCHVCSPLTSLLSWTNVAGGSACDDGLFCTTGDACNVLGECVGGARACADSLSCTGDVCDELQDRCVSQLTGGVCLIDGACVPAGTSDGVSTCRFCDPTHATDSWSFRAAGVPCDDGLFCTSGDVCSGEGACGGTPRDCGGGSACSSSCDENNDSCRSDVASCAIDGACVAAGTVPQGRPCLICDPLRSTTQWSARGAGIGCDDGLYCTLGDVCDASGSCTGSARPCGGLGCSSSCDEASDSCRVGAAGCAILGTCVAPGSTSPLNPCEICDPGRSTTAWSLKDVGASCEDGLFCTSGDTCSASGQCSGAPRGCGDGIACTLDVCDELADRCLSTAITGCLIDGVCHASGLDDPGNACRTCNPAVSAIAWTSKMAGVSCSDGLFCTSSDSCDGQGACVGTLGGCGSASTTGGACASFCDEAADRCQLGGAGCTIGSTCVAGGSDNPDNPCLTCNPTLSSTTWSQKPVGTLCDDGLFCTSDEACTADGTCWGAPRSCSDGLSCTRDACNEQTDTCVMTNADGCVIDNTCVARGDTEPGNSCRTCDPARDPKGWSNAPLDLPCDDGKFCTAEDRCDAAGSCAGRRARCIDDGASCTQEVCDEAADACQPQLRSGCLIAGACIATGFASPRNGCMVCEPESSTTAYSYVADAPSCDSDGDGLRDGTERGEGGDEVDSDGDGRPNHLDPDDDDDSLPTSEESADPDQDGSPNDARDRDLDGKPDYLDPDDDEDGRATEREVDDGETYGDDVDMDATPNWYDIDSDGDGASDLAENLGDGDADDNEKPDYLEPGVTPRDADGDGLTDGQECVAGLASCADSDGDGLIDAEDPDDDNDGVLTRWELRLQRPFDSDRDGFPNHLDPDDDGDTQPTREEGPDPDGDGSPADARDVDADGTPNYLDLDDDGDGIPSAIELEQGGVFGTDVDGDGTPNWLDDDSNGDGLRDLDVGHSNDTDGDGVPEYLQQSAPELDAGDKGVDEVEAGTGGIAGGAGCSGAPGAPSPQTIAFWLLIAAWGGLAWRRRRR